MTKKAEVTLNDTTRRWMAQWDKFEAGEITPQAYAGHVRSGSLALNTAKLKIESGLDVRVGDDDIRIV
jgi:hypothetical protein